MKIRKPVGGKVGNGDPDDVRIVQDLLNKHASAVGFKKLDVDGLVGKRTLKAIAKFQDEAVPEIKRADAKVDPGNLTIKALNQSPGEIAKLIKEGAQGKCVPGVVMKVKGKDVEVPYNEYAKLAKQALENVRRGVFQDCKAKADECRSLWDHFDLANKNSWLDEVVHAFGRFSLPSQSVIKNVESAMAKWDAALKSGDPKKAHAAMSAANKPINDAVDQMREYLSNATGQTSSWIKGLDITKTASFAAVGDFATGRVGSVAADSWWGAATAAAESIATEIGKYSAGDKKQPLGSAMQTMTTNTCLGTLTSSAGKAQIVKQMSKVGAPAASKALAKQAPKLSKTVDPKVMAEYLEKNLIGPGYAMLEKGLTDTVKSMKLGEKDTTWEKIFEYAVTTIAGESVFKKLDAIITKDLTNDVFQFIIKAKLDKNIESIFKTAGVTKTEYFKKNSKAIKEIISTSITGPLAAVYAKSLEEALKKGKGTESAEKLHETAYRLFSNKPKTIRMIGDKIGSRVKKEFWKRFE